MGETAADNEHVDETARRYEALIERSRRGAKRVTA